MPSPPTPATPDAPARPLRVAYFFRRGRAQRLESWRAGQGPDEMLYGLNHLDPARFQPWFLEGGQPGRDWRRGLWKPVERLISRRVGMGFVLHLAWGHLERLRQSDVIVATVDACGLPVAELKRRGLLDTPLIYVSQGLSDRLAAMRPGLPGRGWLRRHYAHLLAAAERVLVLGQGAVEPLERELGLAPGWVECLPFGVDENFWSPDPAGAPAGDYLLSVGSDPARDHDTLLRGLRGLRLKLVTRLGVAPELRWPGCEVGSRFSDLELRQLYRHARLVVIPLQDVAQPSGQSATLQAMACGRPVVLTRTRGLWEPQRLIHGHNCWLVEPGDAQGLRRGVETILARPELAAELGARARRTVEEGNTSRGLAMGLARHILAVAHRGRPGENA